MGRFIQLSSARFDPFRLHQNHFIHGLIGVEDVGDELEGAGFKEGDGEHIAEGGIVVCEHPFGEELEEETDGLVKQKEYKYSKVAVTLYRKV